MQSLSQQQMRQLPHISGGCDSWYHLLYCHGDMPTQAEYEMQFGNQLQADCDIGDLLVLPPA